MNSDKADGIKQRVQGAVDLVRGKVTGNKERELRRQVEITNGCNKKDHEDFRDNVSKGVDSPDNPSNV